MADDSKKRANAPVSKGPRTTLGTRMVQMVRFAGPHLTAAEAEERLGGLLGEHRGKLGIVLDLMRVESYDVAARTWFVERLTTENTGISRVAVLTRNIVFEMVVAGVALMLRGKLGMRSFRDEDEALAWAREG